MRLSDDYHIINDVVLFTERGTTQIDHVVVSRYGVFAIETKNYKGDIYGDDNREQWTQIAVTKNKFYNPVKQSIGHSYEIKKCLMEWPHLIVVPIVVFTDRANLAGVHSKNHVVYENDLIKTIQDYKTIYLSDADVKRVIDLLFVKNVRDIVDDETHIQNVNEVKTEKISKIASGICPKCGGSLILRTGRYGSFYGCSNYPQCKFTTHVRM